MGNTRTVLKSSRRHGRALVLVVALGATLAVPGYAQDPDLQQLRRQLEEVRATVDRLDAQVRLLEHDRAAEPRSDPPASGSGGALASAPGTGGAGGDANTSALSHAEQATLREQMRVAEAIRRWDEIRMGMNQEAVRKVLGEPKSTLPVSNRTGWYYRYSSGPGGSVFFDHDGKVVSIMAPRG